MTSALPMMYTTAWDNKTESIISVRVKVGDLVCWSDKGFIHTGTITEILGPNQFVFQTPTGRKNGRRNNIVKINGRDLRNMH